MWELPQIGDLPSYSNLWELPQIGDLPSYSQFVGTTTNR
ncbi:hypothetical protein G436_3072 [Leptospira interrogans serovar Hardjo str. Norma]|uniref:Uncharacterized protein n=1 Tax=Leptospira interrogans serovar Hardjo str. Norma TaxID=1279460 RepID=A0A0M4MVG3_LEPIR|nr:hypothetical protein G436_3072 [Leptospira interrogans serovar Hardjo str. Norma]